MAKIYTKGGDKGTTSLLSGTRVPKYHIRVEAYGMVDELTSFIGLLKAYNINDEIKSELTEIQQILFNISGLLSCDKGKHLKILTSVADESIVFLEKSIDKMSAQLKPLTKFILPGGQKEVGYAHVCRTVARKTERRIVELADKEKIEQNIIIYINRLSDYFFTLSRYISMQNNFEQTNAK
ncbi:MAG: cob(I)yrinic acid a,c-diamide adenosyltransferase [Bacteroidota bacterium]|nr:cob(I)yrinic acid a,c-diamide adenosyltransferase [Bacteroidota bacterium]